MGTAWGSRGTSSRREQRGSVRGPCGEGQGSVLSQVQLVVNVPDCRLSDSRQSPFDGSAGDSGCQLGRGSARSSGLSPPTGSPDRVTGLGVGEAGTRTCPVTRTHRGAAAWLWEAAARSAPQLSSSVRFKGEPLLCLTSRQLPPLRGGQIGYSFCDARAGDITHGAEPPGAAASLHPPAASVHRVPTGALALGETVHLQSTGQWRRRPLPRGRGGSSGSGEFSLIRQGAERCGWCSWASRRPPRGSPACSGGSRPERDPVEGGDTEGATGATFGLWPPHTHIEC